MITLEPDLVRGLSHHFTTDRLGTGVLGRNEFLLVEKAVEKRRIDFATGRFCARKALAAFGRETVEILRGPDREPLWPAGITGSISHTAGLVGAIAARTDEFGSVGLDVEVLGTVSPETWGIAFTDSEREYLNSLPAHEASWFAALFFSAKESFYKMQFPLTRKLLGFEDVTVLTAELLREHATSGTISLELLANGEQYPVRWMKTPGHVITVCVHPGKEVQGSW